VLSVWVREWLEGDSIRVEKYLGSSLISREWRKDGRLHREGGPAVERFYPDGRISCREWRIGGELHREDGPAYEDFYGDGSPRYFL